MRITSKGQVTIPREVRERLGLLPETEVDFVIKGNAVQIVKAKGRSSRAANVVGRIRGRATTKLSTDEIMKLTRG
ncbi:MAG TPA: AbrB/MazE/SpoVT family DNA-binding domain-containing protein [Thermoanaerobaculia bacterium]